MSDAVKEIVGVLKDALVTPVQEAFVYRARNPFFGTLVISWIFYNWDKVAYFFLSKSDILERINFIRTKMPDNSVIFGQSISHTHSFWFPFAWSLLLSVLYPFLTFGAIYIHKWITSKIESINSIKEKSRLSLQKDLVVLMAINESAKTKQLALEESEIEEHREVTANHKANIESLKKKKTTLTDEIEALSSVNDASNAALKNLNSNIEKKQTEYEELLTRYDELAQRFSSMDRLALINKDMENHISHLEAQGKAYLNEISDGKALLLEKDKEISERSQHAKEQAREIAFRHSELNDMRAKLNSFGDSIVNLAKRFNNIFIVNNKTGEVNIQENYISALESMNDGNVVTIYPKTNDY